jgi:acyl carrier protein
MRNNILTLDPLAVRLKQFLVASLNLEDIAADTIDNDEPLLGGRIGLDSLDLVELTMCLEEDFGVTIHGRGDAGAVLANIGSLAAFVRAHAGESWRAAATRDA